MVRLSPSAPRSEDDGTLCLEVEITCADGITVKVDLDSNAIVTTDIEGSGSEPNDDDRYREHTHSESLESLGGRYDLVDLANAALATRRATAYAMAAGFVTNM